MTEHQDEPELEESSEEFVEEKQTYKSYRTLPEPEKLAILLRPSQYKENSKVPWLTDVQLAWVLFLDEKKAFTFSVSEMLNGAATLYGIEREMVFGIYLEEAGRVAGHIFWEAVRWRCSREHEDDYDTMVARVERIRREFQHKHGLGDDYIHSYVSNE